MRAIEGHVKEAKRVTRPPCIPPARPRAQSKKYGLRFEKLVAKACGGTHGAWWQYEDDAGWHYCQTDVLVFDFAGNFFVLECKLTEIPRAWEQLERLYLPVVSRALKRPARGIIVARHLTKRSDVSKVVGSLSEAMRLATSEFYPTLHWLGKGPI